MVKTWATHKPTEAPLNNGWRLVAVGGWRLAVGGGWHRRRRSKTVAVSLKHWKGRRGGVQEGVPPLLPWCTAPLIHPCKDDAFPATQPLTWSTVPGYLGALSQACLTPAIPLTASGLSLRTPTFLLSLKDSPQRPPTANRQPPPTAANRRQPLFNTVSVLLCLPHQMPSCSGDNDPQIPAFHNRTWDCWWASYAPGMVRPELPLVQHIRQLVGPRPPLLAPHPRPGPKCRAGKQAEINVVMHLGGSCRPHAGIHCQNAETEQRASPWPKLE